MCDQIRLHVYVEKIRLARLRWLGHVERKTEEDVAMRTWKMEVE